MAEMKETDEIKISCNVARDLLILYGEEACSEDSRRLVETHLRGCQECEVYLKRLKFTDEILTEEVKEEMQEENMAVRRSFRKIRKWWAISLLAVFMIFPVMGMGVLGVHEFMGEGMALSNLDDINRCMDFLRCIERKDFEAAAEYADFSTREYRMIDEVKNLTEEEFQEYMQEKLVRKLQEYDGLGLYIDNISYQHAYRTGRNEWQVEISFDENYPDGSSQRLGVSLDGDNMQMGAFWQDKWGTEKMLYIDQILYLYAGDDPLGYRECETAFEVDEGEKASIAWKGSGVEPGDIALVSLVDVTYGTILDISESFLTGREIWVSVPGQYSVMVYTHMKEEVFLDEEDLEIMVYEIGCFSPIREK